MKTILVIENDQATLQTICTILELNGIRSVPSETIWSVDDIRALNPDVILIDYLLSDGLGNVLCLHLKQDSQTSHIPVIMMSAVNDVENIALASLADDFIYKPFDLLKFEQKIKKYAVDEAG